MKQFLKEGGCGILMALLICIMVIGCIDANRYTGHSGYFFFWQDFNAKAVHLADFDNDLYTTQDEIRQFKHKFMNKHNLHTSTHRSNEMYDTNNRKIPAHELAKYLDTLEQDMK